MSNNKVIILDTQPDKWRGIILMFNLSDGNGSILQVMITETDIGILSTSIKSLLKKNSE